MPALFFPNPDALRLVLASGAVPPEITDAPARVGSDDHGRLWLEPAALPSREVLAALGRLGVQVHGGGGVPTAAVGCWAELLPLRRFEPHLGPAPAGLPGRVLFELPDTQLAAFAAELRRLSGGPVGVRLLTDGGRAWVTADNPPLAVLLRCQDPASGIEPFAEQRPGVWALAGWEHPLPDRVASPPGHIVLLRPPRLWSARPDPVPVPRFDEYRLPPQTRARVSDRGVPVIPIRFTLARSGEPQRETLWVCSGWQVGAFYDYCRSADERVLRRFEAAELSSGGEVRVVVRAAGGKRVPPYLLVPAVGYAPDPRAAGLFVPAGRGLRPVLRVRELARVFDLGPDRVTWVEPGPDGSVVRHFAPVSAFRPMVELIEYVPPVGGQLPGTETTGDPFPFARVALQEDRPTITDTPAPADALPAPTPDRPAAEQRPGWLVRSLERLARRLRPPGEPPTAPRRPDPKPAGRRSHSPRESPSRWESRSGRVEQKLSSADALLHGHARAARRHELESRLLAELPLLGPDQRAARWAELAAVYGATGNPTDAAVCWMNAAWEADDPPDSWLEQWFLAECRAAKHPDARFRLDRVLAEPGRFGAGRVLAAFVVRGARQSPPPAELVAVLPRVIALLEQAFDDLPVRAAWLARVAANRLCDGDALGLARWRDRVLARLREKGPGLDLDEPSFLRFHGTASADRFQTAREWLARIRDPIFGWVNRLDRLGTGGKLRFAGLDPETECTAAYAQLMLAWGLGCLGERTRSRDWAARARKVLARPAPDADPQVHAVLADAFAHRIRDAQEGRPARPGLPDDLRARIEGLSGFARYAVDKLREHSRILEPVDRVNAFRGLDLREFRGHDRLGERLNVLADRIDPGYLTGEARELLAVCAADPSSAVVPRVTLTLLEVAPHLDGSVIPPLLGQLVPALDWLEAWLQGGRWSEAERAEQVPRFLGRLLSAGLVAAAWFNQWPAARPAVEYLVRQVTHGGDVLRRAVELSAASLFRSLRKLGFRAEAEAVLDALDPGRGDPPGGGPFPPSRLGLAVGWFAVGDEDAGMRVLNLARARLFLAGPTDDRHRTALAIAYAEALGSAPPQIVPGRLAEIFQQLDRITVRGSTNVYYTLKPLELIDTVVRSVVTEDFALGPAVRGWLDDDEFLIRRRVHRDMAAVLREQGIS